MEYYHDWNLTHYCLIGSNRLPTYSRGAHRKFFPSSLHFFKRNFDNTVTIVAVKRNLSINVGVRIYLSRKD